MTNRPKGFGFVKFASEEAANKAKEEMNGKASFLKQCIFSSAQALFGMLDYHMNFTGNPKIQFKGWLFLSQQVHVEYQSCKQGLRSQKHTVFFLLDLINANLQQVLNGRVIYVDIAKAKMNRTTDSSPRATGPPKPPDRC